MKKNRKDQHLSRNMVRLADQIHALMKEAAAENDRSLTKEIHRVLTRHLESIGKLSRKPPDTPM